MDLDQLCQLSPEKKSVLATLLQDAGQREEEWQRRIDQPGELYHCPPADVHKRIYEEIKKHYGPAVREWFTSQHISALKSTTRGPCLLKKGMIGISKFVLFIPFPPQTFEVQYLPDKEDPSSQQPFDLRGPTLLPRNSALIVGDSEIRFLMIIFEPAEDDGKWSTDRVKEKKG